jgi:hypothetical protein
VLAVLARLVAALRAAAMVVTLRMDVVIGLAVLVAAA